jgi:integrase/recombinase XerD
MSELRARMIEQMQLHRKAPSTQDQYVQAIAGLAAYYKRSPDQLSSQEIRGYLHYLLTERTSPGAHATSWRPLSGFSMSKP